MNRILVALDVNSLARAREAVSQLAGAVGGFKIGKELFTAEGPAVVHAIAGDGHRVFLDLKFHDIPTTVAGAVRSAARLGVWMLTIHASGGPAMMAAAREAAERAVAETGWPRPLIAAITVLTSLDDQMLAQIGVAGSLDAQVRRLAQLARKAGADGVVCSPREISVVREACGDDFLIVTPGIRPVRAAGSLPQDDQARTLTAAESVAAGADYLVIGRPILAAADPRAAAIALGRDIDRREPSAASRKTKTRPRSD
jgi:orotidine-5'-phosphate decarboxylase